MKKITVDKYNSALHINNLSPEEKEEFKRLTYNVEGHYYLDVAMNAVNNQYYTVYDCDVDLTTYGYCNDLLIKRDNYVIITWKEFKELHFKI